MTMMIKEGKSPVDNIRALFIGSWVRCVIDFAPYELSLNTIVICPNKFSIRVDTLFYMFMYQMHLLVTHLIVDKEIL